MQYDLSIYERGICTPQTPNPPTPFPSFSPWICTVGKPAVLVKVTVQNIAGCINCFSVCTSPRLCLCNLYQIQGRDSWSNLWLI